MRLRIAMAFFTALALLSTQAPALAADCMRANQAGAIAEGRLIERDDAIILKLPQAMCLEGPEDSDSVPASTEIHVYSLDDKIHQTLRGLIGKDVQLRGTFMGAMTQHHKSPVVMQVTEADEI
jgi:hypothetical protein